MNDRDKEIRMKLVDGLPVCYECQQGIHNHITGVPNREDCKNVGQVNGKTYQCHCGFGRFYQGGRWIEMEIKETIQEVKEKK